MNKTIFRTHVALPLECDARRILGESCGITADWISLGGFITAMEILLYHEKGADTDIFPFLQKCQSFLGTSSLKFDADEALALYEEFRVLLADK